MDAAETRRLFESEMTSFAQLKFPATARFIVVIKTKKRFDTPLLELREYRQEGVSFILVTSQKILQLLTSEQRRSFDYVFPFWMTKEEMDSVVFKDLDRVQFVNVEPVIQRLLQVIPAERVQLVVAEEPILRLAAKLRTKYGMKGLQVHELKRFVNKEAMKEAMGNQVAAPRYIAFDNRKPPPDVATVRQHIGPPPWILKPQNSCGSADIHKLQGDADYTKLTSQWSNEKHLEHRPPMILEDFIDGQEYAAYMLVDSEGKATNLRIFGTLTSIYSFINEGKPVSKVELNRNSDFYRRCVDFVARVTAALAPLPPGMFSVEFFLQKSTNKLLFSEVAARRPGGRFPEILQHTTGINAEAAHILASLPEADGKLRGKSEKAYAAYLRFPRKRGTVKEFNKAPLGEGNLQIIRHVKIGDETSPPSELSKKCELATIVHYSEDPEKLLTDTKILLNFEPARYA